MTVVYENSSDGLRIIGHGHGIYFYDQNRTLRQELYLGSDNILHIDATGESSGDTGANGIDEGILSNFARKNEPNVFFGSQEIRSYKSDKQLRLTYSNTTNHVDFGLNESGYFRITPTGGVFDVDTSGELTRIDTSGITLDEGTAITSQKYFRFSDADDNVNVWWSAYSHLGAINSKFQAFGGNTTENAAIEINATAPATYIGAVELEATSVGATVQLYLLADSDGDSYAYFTGTGGLGVGGALVVPANTLYVENGADYLGFTHGGSNAIITWNDGALILQNEETDTIGDVYIRGDGTGRGRLRLYDADDSDYLQLQQIDSDGYIEAITGNLNLQYQASGNAMFFADVDTDEHPYVEIYGDTGDTTDSLRIAVNTSAADTASFDGVSNYVFDGKVRASTADIGDGTNDTVFLDDGIMTMTGTARVKKDIWISADGFRVPGTKPAAQVDYGIADAWEFTDGTDDTLFARVKLPDDMDKSAGMTIYIGWSTPTGSAGNCRWQVEYLFRQADEAMDAAADATLVDNFAASATAKGLVISTIGTTAVPNAADVCLTMRIKRRADEAADTLGEDNYLFGLCVEYTSNKLGTAT